MRAAHVLLGLVVAGSGASPAQDARLAPGVTGRVVDADTGAPLGGVNVGSRERGWFETDAAGRFEIPSVPDGSHTLWIQSRYLGSAAAPPVLVRVEAGRAPGPIEFRVRLEGTVSGRVTDERGEPVANARVQLVGRFFDITGGTSGVEYAAGESIHAASELTAVAIRLATTDTGGYYTIRRVPAGVRYRVLASLPRRYTLPLSNAPTDPGARPPALVATYHPAAPSFDVAQDVVVQSNESRPGVDVRMRRAPAYCLEATLVPDGSYGRPSFSLEEEEVSRIRQVDSGAVRVSGYADEQGRVRLCDLHAGRWLLTADGGRSAPVSIAGADLTGVTVTPARPVTVSVEVEWDDAAPRGPRTALQITTYPREVPWTPLQDGLTLSLSSATRYGLVLAGLYPWYYVRDITYAGGTASDASILHGALVAGETGGTGRLRLSMAADGGRIAMRVRRNGADVPYAMVLVWPADAPTDAALASQLVAGLSSESGGFLTGSLRPGRYYALASHDSPPHWLGSADLRPHVWKSPDTIALLRRLASHAVPVVVPPRTAVPVELAPTPMR